MRVIWIIAGWASFGLGAVGAFLPLLPTVPFMLLAAFCFARGSQRFHDWLVAHPNFGPAIRDWQREGAISPRGKTAAMIGIGFSFALSIALDFSAMVLGVQAVVLAVVAAFILTRPHGSGAAGDDQR